MPKDDYEKLTILVDMDDTIENLLVHWIGWLNETHGTSVDAEEIRSWNIQEAFPSLTTEQVYEPLLRDEFWLRVTPKPDAQDYLQTLADDGHEIYITTSSNYKTIPVKMEHVLFKYFPWLDWDHVIIASKKQMIRGDVMVDDGPHNLEGGKYYKILMDAPHNRDYRGPDNGWSPVIPASDGALFNTLCDGTSYGKMIRAGNWSEVYSVITHLAQSLYEIDEEFKKSADLFAKALEEKSYIKE